jgi:hypothetical protein
VSSISAVATSTVPLYLANTIWQHNVLKCETDCVIYFVMHVIEQHFRTATPHHRCCEKIIKEKESKYKLQQGTYHSVCRDDVFCPNLTPVHEQHVLKGAVKSFQLRKTSKHQHIQRQHGQSRHLISPQRQITEYLWQGAPHGLPVSWIEIIKSY